MSLLKEEKGLSDRPNLLKKGTPRFNMNRGVYLWLAVAEVAAFTAAAATAFTLLFAFADPQDSQDDGDADGREDQDI
jgi:hypothetical protein